MVPGAHGEFGVRTQRAWEHCSLTSSSLWEDMDTRPGWLGGRGTDVCRVRKDTRKWGGGRRGELSLGQPLWPNLRHPDRQRPEAWAGGILVSMVAAADPAGGSKAGVATRTCICHLVPMSCGHVAPGYPWEHETGGAIPRVSTSHCSP